MSKKFIFILNLSENNSLSFDKENINHKIIYFSSLLNNSYINLFPNCMIAMISIKNGLLIQISHFSGNKNHHNQGLLRLIKKNFHGKFGIKDAFFFAKKLFGKSEFFSDKEIVLFTNENSNEPLQHVYGTFLKEKYKFSAFLFGERIFIFEILAKITNGSCFLIDSNCSKIKKLPNHEKKTEPNSKNIFPIEISNIETKFFFGYLNSRKEVKISNKLKTFCDNCGFNEKKLKYIICPNCFNLNFKNRNLFPVLKKKNFLKKNFLNLADKFSIFSSHHTKNNFLWFISSKINPSTDNLKNSLGLCYEYACLGNEMDSFRQMKSFKRNNLFTIY